MPYSAAETMVAIISKSGRTMQVTNVSPPQDGPIEPRVEQAIISVDAARLRGLTPEVRGRDIAVRHRFEGIAVHGPPLCVMLEYIKGGSGVEMDKIQEALKVMVVEWAIDPNAEFKATETRQSTAVDITCTPMSWLMRERAVVNIDNLNRCITALVALGADASLPFMVTPENASTPNGLSLPYIALNSLQAIMCADCLLKCGARFSPTDPSPMCAAMKIVETGNAIRFFYDHKRDIDDVLKMDTDGNTAIHIFIASPPSQHALELMALMLEMGFSHDTKKRDGTTALEFANSQRHRNHTKMAIFNRLNAIKTAHDREMSVVGVKVMASACIPQEVIKIIWDRLAYGTITMEAATRASDRARSAASAAS